MAERNPTVEVRTVTARVKSALVDRTKWKSYAPVLEFDNLFIPFEVPVSEIVKDADGTTTITLSGFAVHVLDPFATAVEDMHNKWSERVAKAEEALYTTPKPE